MSHRPSKKAVNDADTYYCSRNAFCLRFFGSIIILVGCYSALVVLVDPRGDFGTQIFRQVTMDSRITKMALFDLYSRRTPVDGIVIGSSRSMKVSPSLLEAATQKRWFNFSVDSAQAEDYLAIFRWAHRRDIHLSMLAIGLDVEALHDSSAMDARLERNPMLMAELGYKGNVSDVYSRVQGFLRLLKSSLSRSYAQDILESLVATFYHLPPSSSFDANGLLHYNKWEGERNSGPAALNARISQSKEEYRRRFQGMHNLSIVREEEIETLLDEAGRDKIRIVLWITPLHPTLITYLEKESNYEALLENTENYVRDIGLRFEIPVFDFSSPESFGGTDDHWFDGAHIDDVNALLLEKRLEKALPAKR